MATPARKAQPVKVTQSGGPAKGRRPALAVVKAPTKTSTRPRRQTKPETHPAPDLAGLGKNATPLERQVYGMQTEHIQCRDFGHSWRPFSARWVASNNYFESTFRCSRCTTVKIRHIGSRGQLLDTNYDYVEGYTVQGMGRLSGTDRDVIRLASVRSVLVTDTAEE